MAIGLFIRASVSEISVKERVLITVGSFSGHFAKTNCPNRFCGRGMLAVLIWFCKYVLK